MKLINIDCLTKGSAASCHPFLIPESVVLQAADNRGIVRTKLRGKPIGIAVIQKNSGIVKMVTALSGLLKNMTKGFNEKVTLKKELEFLNDYVTIEKVKYVELFDLEIQVDDPGLYEAKVIKLTLQPLVENAIFNGIEPKGRHGIIKIRASRQEDMLVLTVRDNGVGIPKERLKTLLENTEKVKGNSMSGIGLPNVDRRIKLNYGESYSLMVDSTEGKFTEITVTMPLEF